MVGGQDTPTGEAKRSSLTVRPLPGALGAEIDGVDLSSPLDPRTVQAIREIWLQYLVVFFRDQTLGARELAAFARLFGTPMPYPMVAGVPEEPHVIEVLKREDETVNFGGLWHTDTAYLERPPMGSLLYALEVPQVGGDTLFANGYLAFDALSPGMQAMLERLRAVNRSDGAAVSATRAPRSGSLQDRSFQAVHPVVRTHPETGRKVLYVNGAHSVRFDGMTEDESEPLLRWLFAHQSQAPFTARFQWTAGSLAFWDNRAALHYPLNDYHGHRRRMLRIQIEGDRPA